ncbi:MAG: type II toxin-antitoxin system VapC family toxin [Leptolyngbyaceae bacterium]|nr:type II toxin-antitoxin system VapC family toxin [Leptolyngbyaceae bacterium]
MLILVDTNVLLRFADRSHPLHPLIRTAVRELSQDGHKLQVSSQNCIEFWNVATCPIERNGFGLDPAEAEQLLQLIERLFPVLPDSSEIYKEWRRLVVVFGVSGVQVHDARLVASMKVNAISHILTLNVEDFKRYIPEGITAIAAGTAAGTIT